MYKVLVTGFVRNIRKLMNDQVIPEEINDLCFRFYSHIITVNSVILTNKELGIFGGLLTANNCDIGMKWKLIYRGTRDTFEWRAFNKQCTDTANVICIILSKHGHVFGGYTSVGFPKCKSYYKPRITVKDESAFLYTLRNTEHPPEIFRLLRDDDKVSISNYGAYMCCFGGGGSDLSLFENCDQNERAWVEHSQFEYPIGNRSVLNGGNRNFSVVEVELFECCN